MTSYFISAGFKQIVVRRKHASHLLEKFVYVGRKTGPKNYRQIETEFKQHKTLWRTNSPC